MIYILLVTALINGHPDTQATGRYIDKPACEKAAQVYKAKQAARGVVVYAVACLPTEGSI